jgi:hypothetical protein
MWLSTALKAVMPEQGRCGISESSHCTVLFSAMPSYLLYVLWIYKSTCSCSMSKIKCDGGSWSSVLLDRMLLFSCHCTNCMTLFQTNSAGLCWRRPCPSWRRHRGTVLGGSRARWQSARQMKCRGSLSLRCQRRCRWQFLTVLPKPSHKTVTVLWSKVEARGHIFTIFSEVLLGYIYSRLLYSPLSLFFYSSCICFWLSAIDAFLQHA